MILMTINAEGLPTAFYDDAIHSDIPDGAIEITEEQHGEFIANPGERRWDGSTGATYAPPFNLALAKLSKKREIRDTLARALEQGVTDSGGLKWDARAGSAPAMDVAIRATSAAAVTLFDVSNVGHILTITEAEGVVALVSADYQTKLAAKQAAMVSVDALPDGSTQANVDAI